MADHSHPFANAVVAVWGVAYFSAWSFSFYPQILLNFQRKTTIGLSPDFVYVNPLGFLALTIWNWGIRFSPSARRQYEARHDGHAPQVADADLAFSMHAMLISLVTLSQVFWYARRTKAAHETGEERNRLLPSAEGGSKLDITTPISPATPSVPCQIALAGIVIASLVSASLVWIGKTELLDWLYFASSMKLIISVIKYVPQVLLNWRIRSVEGFAIGQILLDLAGSVLSFAQLVVSSVFIEHDPSGIIANPAKLGLALLSLIFDVIFLVQKYFLFPGRSIEEGKDPDEEEQLEDEDT